MWRCLDVCGEVQAGMMPTHVQPTLPETAIADIDHPALMSDVNGPSFFTVALGQVFRGEFLIVSHRSFIPCLLA
jgi:hypothetical protein